MRRPSSDVSSDREPGYRFGGFHLDPDGTLLNGDTAVHLAPKELAALRLLLRQSGRVVTFADLRSELWGNVHVTADSIPRCISSLRARLGSEDSIRAVYKRGYRLAIPARRDEVSPPGALPRLVIAPFSVGPNVPDHLGSILAEEATSRLTAVHPRMASVLARDSVFTLAARGMSAHDIGSALNADLVLTGVVRGLASHLRLRVEMVRMSDGTQIWVEDMLVPRDRVALLHSELAERIAWRVGGELSSTAAAETENAPSPEAYEMFLRGRYEWQSLERHRMQDAVQHLTRAVEMEPNLTAARIDMVHACLAQEMLGYISPLEAAFEVRRFTGSVPQESEVPPPDCRETLPALGWLTFHVDHDLPSAIRILAQAGSLPPDSWRTGLRALFAASLHRFDEASDLLADSLRLDPYSPWLNGALAWTYHLAGRAEESVRQIAKCLAFFPEHVSTKLFGGVILACNGEARRAVALTRELARAVPPFDLAMAIHAYALACEGSRKDAAEMLEKLQWLSRERFTMRAFTAPAYVVLGEHEQAISELRAAEESRGPWFFQMLADPRLAALHQHPEFKAMRGRLLEVERQAMEAEQAARQFEERLTSVSPSSATR
ncbi:MAG TPA: winged helix-turn-helix domain-containing protein [Terracidiphilus sp.]|nr:winged helix-turn-helix domain-containing protein [Terracidiphilus sp.]